MWMILLHLRLDGQSASESHGVATVFNFRIFLLYQIVFTTDVCQAYSYFACVDAGVVMFTNITDFCWILLQFFHVC